ncbi:MAG: ribosome biogenesis GTPase Der [Pseudomonadota bacterium]|nr:ribosome biogenesis GTPase Der [Pseudomonadota bacterium]
MKLTVAIVGRPNVGKSTLFNRLVGKKLALVDDLPGVTRDRREGDGRIGPLEFRVIDTAGLEEAFDDSLEARMRRQTERALDEADVVLMLVDARAGITPLDKHFADWLRGRQVPVVLVANKCEGRAGTPGMLESYELGLGDPVPISAEHGEGMADLHDAIAEYAPEDSGEDGTAEVEGDKPLLLAVVGRPNAGKSTLINRLIGEDRLLTGPEAGITRDSIAVDWRWKDQAVRLYDTAGMRRRARVDQKLEKLAVADGLRAVQYAEVVVLLVDATQAMERQDLLIARQTLEEGRALVIGINKWDLVDQQQAVLAGIRERLENQLAQAKGVPLVTLSAVTGRGVDRLMPAVLKAHKAWNIRIATARLNRWLEEVVARHPPPLVNGRRFRIRYMTQVKARPPTFALFTSSGGTLPEAYERYLVNGMRDVFGLQGVPIRITLRKSKNPYAPEDTRK